MDLLENNGSFPPNVTLSPMNNSYQSQTSVTTVMNTNSRMLYPQQSHHQPSNLHYRQSSQQQSMYNNYVQSSPNQSVPSYYSMPPSIQQTQQRMSPVNHHQSQIVKRQSLIQQQQQQRTPAQTNQQLQLHMSMNVTLPHVKILVKFSSYISFSLDVIKSTTNNTSTYVFIFLFPKKKLQISIHLAMMNTYNELMMPNNNGPPLQQDYHQYSNTNPADLPYSPDLFMSSSSNLGQQSVQNRHMNVMQHQQSPMHQV
jgi:hypothetical protein